MDRNIESYLKIYDMIPEDKCEGIIQKLQQCDTWKEHSYYNAAENRHIKNSDEFDVCDGQWDINSYIQQKVWDTLLQYVKDINFPWFNSWSAFTPVRYNRYSCKTKMDNHCDTININPAQDGTSLGNPTLSVLGCLNNNYAGGELVFYNDTQIELKAGQIAVFPSNFLYPHKVLPITEGNRYSFICWAWK